MADNPKWEDLFRRATLNGDVEALREAVSEGLPLNEACLYETYTPLQHVAYRTNEPSLLAALIEAGADVNIRMPEDCPTAGHTALMLAAAKGRLALVNVLLGAGADVHVTDQLGSNALGEAARGGGTESHTAVVRELLATGARPDAQTLLYAAWNGNPEIVGLLLAAGVGPNEPSRLGLPLQWAVGMGQFANAEVLLGAGADPTLHPPTNYGHFSAQSALELARESGNPAVLTMLTAQERQESEKAKGGR
jgi:ankyrin repeat protein